MLADPTYFPRLLHFVLAGIAFAGAGDRLVGSAPGAVGAEVELNTAIARYAWKWVLWTTVLQVVDGFVLLLLLPKPVLVGFMQGGAATMIPLTLVDPARHRAVGDARQGLQPGDESPAPCPEPWRPWC